MWTNFCREKNLVINTYRLTNDTAQTKITVLANELGEIVYWTKTKGSSRCIDEALKNYPNAYSIRVDDTGEDGLIHLCVKREYRTLDLLTQIKKPEDKWEVPDCDEYRYAIRRGWKVFLYIDEESCAEKWMNLPDTFHPKCIQELNNSYMLLRQQDSVYVVW